MIDAVIFDLDGVLIDSEHVWDDVREALAHERGGRWHPGAQRAMMGMSSPEWSRYMHEEIGLREEPAEINRLVVARMLERYAAGPPWLPGAREAVRRVAAAYTLGLASSSNRELIDPVLEAGGIAPLFRASVSSEEVAGASPRPTSTSRRRAASASSPPCARPSRTHTTASARRRRRACAASRSPTLASRRATPSARRMPWSAPSPGSRPESFRALDAPAI